MNAVQRADAELAAVRRHATALRASLATSSPWLWLPAGAIAGALAARVLPARRAGGGAPFAALIGLVEGRLLAGLRSWLAPTPEDPS